MKLYKMKSITKPSFSITSGVPHSIQAREIVLLELDAAIADYKALFLSSHQQTPKYHSALRNMRNAKRLLLLGVSYDKRKTYTHVKIDFSSGSLVSINKNWSNANWINFSINGLVVWVPYVPGNFLSIIKHKIIPPSLLIGKDNIDSQRLKRCFDIQNYLEDEDNHAQSFTDTLKQVMDYSGMGGFMTRLSRNVEQATSIGVQGAVNSASNALVDIISKIFFSSVSTVAGIPAINTLLTKSAAFFKNVVDVVGNAPDWTAMLLQLIVDFTLKIARASTSGPSHLVSTLIDLVSMGLSIFNIKKAFDGMLKGSKVEPIVLPPIPEDANQSNSGTTFFILTALAASFLPQDAVKLIQRIGLLTSTKICDNISLMFDAYRVVASVLASICDMVGMPTDILATIKSYISLEHYVIVNECRDLVDKWKKNRSLILDPEFRLKVERLNESREKSVVLIDMAAKNASIRAALANFSSLVKAVSSYTSASRREPICLVFESPPSRLKSVIATKLISALRMTCYSHIVKSIGDGKDFYDTYDNQDVMLLDDVGQAGKSQWRTIINMVSSTKMPLDCAQAELKDTKYFNSDVIIATTNCFRTLSGFTSKDGVENEKALWRRGFVISFDKVERNGGTLRGTLNFMHYCMKSNCFLNQFPPDLCRFFMDNNVKIQPFIKLDDFTHDENQDGIAWLSVITKSLLEMKKQQFSTNTISPQFLDTVDNLALSFIDRSNSEGSVEESSDDDDECHFGHGDFVSKNVMPVTSKNNIFVNKSQILDEVRVNTLPDNLPETEEDFSSYSLPTYQDGDSSPPPYYDGGGATICSEPSPTDDIGSNVRTITTGTAVFHNGRVFLPETCFDYIKVVGSIFLDGLGMWLKSDSILKNFAAVGFCHVIGFAFVQLVMYLVSKGLHMFAYMFVTTVAQSSTAEIPSALLERITASTNRYFTNPHTSVSKILSQVFACDIIREKKKSQLTCLVSGRTLITMSHGLDTSEAQVIIYKDKTRNHRLVDHLPITKVYENKLCDISVWKLPPYYPAPFSNLCDKFNSQCVEMPSYVVTADGLLDGQDCNFSLSSGPAYYYHKTNKLQVFNPVIYKAEYDGMCGSPIVSRQGYILGIHVAGNNRNGNGFACRWDAEVAEILKTLTLGDKNLLPIGIKPKVIDNLSGIKLESNLNLSSPTTSNIVPNPIFYETFPVTRAPVDLQIDGKHTIKTLAKNAMVGVKPVFEEEIEFATKVISLHIPKFTDITDAEVINGNSILSSMAKDTSNGLCPIKDKRDCYDYELGVVKPAFRKIVNDLENRINNGDDVLLEDVVFTMCPKDEVKDIEKPTPRAFAIPTAQFQFLLKRSVGDLVSKLWKNRSFNKIMVGINPFKDWPDLYNAIRPHKVFAGDIGKFDKTMLPQVMYAISKCIAEKYVGPNRKVLEFLLQHHVTSILGVNDDTFLSTHSLPSGSYLTSYFGSLVNKFYKIMWFKRQIPDASTRLYFDTLDDYVYGDDNLCAMKNSKFENILNAITLRDFFATIGVVYTSYDKKPITQPFDPIDQITFLKRTFRPHHALASIVAPLSLDTIENGISWIDKTKDFSQVTRDKLNSFQREIYLHEDLYESYVDRVEERAKKNGFPFTRLTSEYLDDLYYSEGGYDPEYNERFRILNV